MKLFRQKLKLNGKTVNVQGVLQLISIGKLIDV